MTVHRLLIHIYPSSTIRTHFVPYDAANVQDRSRLALAGVGGR
jgi:hypothetical protein